MEVQNSTVLVTGSSGNMGPYMTDDLWTVEDPEQRQSEMTDFLKNATLFGAALVLVAFCGTAWPYALNIGL